MDYLNAIKEQIHDIVCRHREELKKLRRELKVAKEDRNQAYAAMYSMQEDLTRVIKQNKMLKKELHLCKKK